jgi:D-inositol-3-phosphate glycosyltransferase
MRIAMISEHASPLATLGGVDAGGQNVHVAALATALAGRGHDVDVYTRRDAPGRPDPVRLAPGVHVVAVPAGPALALPKDELLPWMPDFGDWLAANWTSTGQFPDVVHAHFWMSGIAALRAVGSVPADLPVVQTFHALGAVKRRFQGLDDSSPPSRTPLERMLADQVDQVIATCTDELAELSRLGAVPRETRIVPCGVDLQLFSPTGGLDLPAGVPRIGRGRRLLCVGRLVERKGVDTVVTALAQLPDCHLVIAGGPAADQLDQDPEVLRLRRHASELGVADRLHLIGRVDHEQLPDLVRWSDIVVTTPWYEPFGMVALEAMACGRPLIASAVGGLQDTVVPGETGLLVPPRDPGAVAAAVDALRTDPDLRRSMGRRGRRRAAARYGWEQIAAEVEQAYAELLSRAPARSSLLAAEAR